MVRWLVLAAVSRNPAAVILIINTSRLALNYKKPPTTMIVDPEKLSDSCRLVRCSAYFGEHYDALWGVAILQLPVYPVQMVHVKYLKHTMTDGGLGKETTYQIFAMRWAIRNVLKAYLTTWPYILLLIGPFIGPAFIILFLGNTIGPQAHESFGGRIALVVTFFVPFIVGASLTPWYWIMERKDRIIKTIIGETEVGVSDPYYWPDETILAVQSSRQAPDLPRAAIQALDDGDQSTAMLFIRMAQRIDPGPHPDPARDLEILFRKALPREFAGF